MGGKRSAPHRYGSAKRKRYSNSARNSAASRIQKAFRSRRNLSTKVNRIITKREPLQYSLRGQDRLAISTTPQIVAAPADMVFNNTQSNTKFCRTSPKISAKSVLFDINVGVSDSYNMICMAFVRYKRSDEMQNTDIQYGGLGAGPLTSLDDKPFLPCENAGAGYYNTVPLNMLNTTTTIAHPAMLNDMWNGKVVEVIKKWDIQLEAEQAGATYPAFRNIKFFHKFNEEWKFPNIQSVSTAATVASPWNNKSYYLIAWSDSKLVGHPTLSYSYRLTFRDVD